mmetsp:Transcript_65792/g.116823  ORF Transcript_65792/g.116823 Transcript_65792/m.116823 type:complete len:126 (-) Transcript_65792:7-384(-)
MYFYSLPTHMNACVVTKKRALQISDLLISSAPSCSGILDMFARGRLPTRTSGTALRNTGKPTQSSSLLDSLLSDLQQVPQLRPPCQKPEQLHEQALQLLPLKRCEDTEKCHEGSCYSNCFYARKT